MEFSPVSSLAITAFGGPEGYFTLAVIASGGFAFIVLIYEYHFVVPAIPQSEVLAIFLQEIGEKCGEISAKFFADFRPSISRENGRKKSHEKSSTFSMVHEIKFFHCCISGGWVAEHFGKEEKRSLESLI